MNQTPTVVVVGGGTGGVDVAKALDADANAVLLEPKDAFVHNVGALRALVEPAFLPKIFLPVGAGNSVSALTCTFTPGR